MSLTFTRITNGLKRRWVHSGQNRQLIRRGGLIAERSPKTEQRPVIFFNASTRLDGLSLNAAFSLLTSWSLRLSGVPVIYFSCQRGMSRCVLGTNREHPNRLPPCKVCIAQSQRAYAQGDVYGFSHQADPVLECLVEALPIEKMMEFSYQGIPLGRLVVPSIRWILRRHNLADDEKTRFLYREYILSAWGIAQQFSKLVKEVQPQAVVVFNGMFYPEAVTRWVAQNQQPPIRTVSHEVGLRPFSAYFTTGEATAYPIDIPEAFDLSEKQAERLDEYLSQRFKGNFSMAGVRFWPEMQPIEPSFWEHAGKFRQIVPVFTNVIFDTSQDHANLVFPDMFAWLEAVKGIILKHPETLFVIRAHPDESRPGKTSLESVAGWVRQNRVDQIPNVVFVPPNQYFSSYELISRSKFVMIYNSTIGLEASLMGAAVLSGGRARFTQLPTVFFPPTVQGFIDQAESLLDAISITVPAEFQRNARRFLYYQLFRTSLPFDHFLQEDGIWKGYVALKPFKPEDLLPQNSGILQIINDGILRNEPFLLNL